MASGTTSAPSADPGRSTLYSLQVMRGLAAIAVAVYHTDLILTQQGMGAGGTLAALSSRGWTGVNFFFVLSGFIVMYAHARDIGQPARAGRYLWRRFSRVYPVYWVFLTLYIAAAALGVGSPNFQWTGLNLTSAYLLVQLAPHPTLPLQVAWTLFCEVAFYFAFMLLILNRALGVALGGLWLTAIIVIGPVMGTAQPPWFVHSWNLYFIAGIIAYAGFRRLDNRYGMPLLVAGLVMLATCLALGMVDTRIAAAQRVPLKLILLAVPFMLILLGAALAESRHDWTYPRWLLLLGDASYAIYLVHSAVISVLVVLAARFAVDLGSPVLLYTAILVPAVAAGVWAHIIVERPLLGWLRRVEWGQGHIPSPRRGEKAA